MGGERAVALAAIAGAHGVAGEVRLKLFAESLASLEAHRDFVAGAQTLTLLGVRAGNRGAIARFREITDRTAAEALRGQLLTVPRSALPALPAGEYYWHDLLDLAVVDEAGAAVGRVVAVENYGASDLLDIACVDGRRVLVPMIADAVIARDDVQIRVWRHYVDAG